MTPIEIIALLVALLTVIKVIVLLINKEAWMRVPEAIFKQPMVTMIISLILSLVVLYYLLAEITIVQIFAVIGFLMFLIMSMFAAYSKEVMAMANKLIKSKDMFGRSWLPSLIWLAMSVWVLYILLF